MVLCGENVVSRKSKIVCSVKLSRQEFVSLPFEDQLQSNFYNLPCVEQKIRKLDWKSTLCSVIICPSIFIFIFSCLIFSGLLTLFRMGGGEECAKEPPDSFFPVTSTNVRISPQNFLTFSFNPFENLVQNFKYAPSASPKLLNLNKYQPSKKAVFLVKSLQNWGYDNFSYRNARVNKLWSHEHTHNIIWVMWENFVGGVMDIIYDVIAFISKFLFLRRPGVAIFPDIIEILTMFIITINKDWRKVKINRNYVSKCNLYLYLLI